MPTNTTASQFTSRPCCQTTSKFLSVVPQPKEREAGKTTTPAQAKGKSCAGKRQILRRQKANPAQAKGKSCAGKRQIPCDKEAQPAG
jgi:hypothetical protein